PGVLDSDHRLVSKGSNQVDLLLSERLNPISCQGQHANWCILSHEGDAECCTVTAYGRPFLKLILRVAHNVGDLYWSSFEQTAAGNRRPIESQRMLRPHAIHEFFREAIACNERDLIILQPSHSCFVRAT